MVAQLLPHADELGDDVLGELLGGRLAQRLDDFVETETIYDVSQRRDLFPSNNT
jgi:hypothetical protein